MFPLGRKRQDSISESLQMPFDTSKDDSVARIAVAENGKIAFASDAFLELAHLSTDKTQGQDFWEIMRFEGLDLKPQKVDAGIHKIYLNGHEDSFAFHFDWFETPDSRRYLIGSEAYKTTPYKSPEKPHKTPPQIANAQTDNVITNTDIEHFLSLTQEIMLVIDDNGKILRCNAEFENTLLYTQDDLETLTFMDLFAEEDRPSIRNTLQTSALGRDEESSDDPISATTDFESRVYTKTGQRRWMAWRQHYTGQHLYCTGHDITDIKAQQKALSRREKQLSQAESLGRMGHWRWVLDNDAIEWSEEIFRIFGVDPENFTPSLMSMTDMVHREDNDRVNQALQRAVIEENDYDIEFRINRPDGETRFIRSEGRCSRNEEGEVTALFGIMQDMTERVLYESELRQAKDSAERAYAAKSQFLANMSHELRTPLNAIIGFSEMMERQLLGPLGNEKYIDYIGGIRESGEHLLDLISDILDMSKIEAGKYELMLEEMSIAKTVKLAAHMMEGRALEDSIKLTADTGNCDDTKITADRRAVLQILLNLISNAVKFSKEHGEIKVTCAEKDDYVTLKVMDNGIGIPANKLASITRPFEQVSASYSRDHEGSGLGLAITKELTEMHGGSLAIDSKIDHGTTVTIRLPFQPPSQEDQEAKESIDK